MCSQVVECCNCWSGFEVALVQSSYVFLVTLNLTINPELPSNTCVLLLCYKHS